MAWVFVDVPPSGVKPSMILFIVLIFLSGLSVYYLAKDLQKRRGVDESSSYKELPAE